MSVRRISDQKFIIDFYPAGRKGKRVQEVFRGTKTDAYAYEAEARRQGAQLPHSVNPKLIDIIPEYLEWKELHHAPATVKDFKGSWKFLRQVFGLLQVSAITPAIINKYKKLRQGKARATIKELHYLQAVIGWMSRHHPPYAAPLPFKIEKINYKAPLPQIPHPKDIEAFMAEVKDPLTLVMIHLMYRAGLRMKDTRHIRWENIDWNTQTILLTETKGNICRTCVMPPEVIQILSPYRQDKGYVFLNPKTNRPIESLKTVFKNASRRAHIKPLRPHLLRHAFGTYSLAATDNLRLVQELLGHKSIESTTIYTKIMPRLKKIGMQRTAAYIQQEYLDENKETAHYTGK